jgi:hypothetical protein
VKPGASGASVIMNEKGSPTGALVLAGLCGLFLLGSLILEVALIEGEKSYRNLDPSFPDLAPLIPIPIAGVGILLGVVALAVGASSERAKLEFVSSPPAPSTPERSPTLRVSVSPFGVTGSF